jgi:ubiquinone/menaquinone biosynthesis C-methylase UbiE
MNPWPASGIPVTAKRCCTVTISLCGWPPCGEVIRQLYPTGLDGRKVLDIGCGTGDFIALSAELGAASVEGVDISPKVLAKAATRFANDPRVSLERGLVQDCVSQEERYDLITSITVLQHHVEEQELVDTLKVLHRVLKPDGRLIVLELAPPHQDIDRQYSRGMLYLVERPPQVWRSAFHTAGFTVLNEPVMPELGIACLRGINALVTWVLGLPKPASEKEMTAAPSAASVQPGVFSLARRIRRKILAVIRAGTLVLCRPADHWLHLPLPPERYRTYKVFVLGR